jgi:hypothetical protein
MLSRVYSPPAPASCPGSDSTFRTNLSSERGATISDGGQSSNYSSLLFTDSEDDANPVSCSSASSSGRPAAASSNVTQSRVPSSNETCPADHGENQQHQRTKWHNLPSNRHSSNVSHDMAASPVTTSSRRSCETAATAHRRRQSVAKSDSQKRIDSYDSGGRRPSVQDYRDGLDQLRDAIRTDIRQVNSYRISRVDSGRPQRTNR